MENKKYNQEYYKKNKKVINEISKKYNQDNKELIFKNKKKYYQNNKEEILEKKKLYYEQNKERIKEKRKIQRENNKEKIKIQKRKYQQKYLNTPEGKLMHNIRQSIQRGLKKEGHIKKLKSEDILGCNIKEFKEYLESKFELWMNWENKGLYNGDLNYGWDIDHIIPISSAFTEVEILKLNHYTNLQPLCSKINRDIKKNKF
jgi:hypothetical protein